MALIYVATLGKRPEAITVAFDRLRERHPFERMAVLHTEPHSSGIAQAYQELCAVCARDYPDVPLHLHLLSGAHDAPLLDIHDQGSAAAYYRGVLEVLHAYKQDGWHVHLMLAGGRKAMSIYAMLAAGLVFDGLHDRVWTVLSPDSLLAQPGQFHSPPGLREQVQLVELPLRPARVAPGTPVSALLNAPPSRSSGFIAKLTPAEKALAEALRQHPYASNVQLGEMLYKSERTIENQLAGIYGKLIAFLDYGETLNDKRQALIDTLRGE